jgi:CRP-like cAMP-binding protein
VTAPAALAFQEVHEGRPLDCTITAVECSVTVGLLSEEFLAMLSDNIELAQGLFRMLFNRPEARAWPIGQPMPAPAPVLAARGQALQPIEKVLLLRQNPLLARATVNQLLDLVAITREVALTEGAVLLAEPDQGIVYHLLTADVRLDAEDQEDVAPIVAGPGSTIGLMETLAGIPLSRRATVVGAGQALSFERSDLFDVMADHTDLLQGLFSGALNAHRAETDVGLTREAAPRGAGEPAMEVAE